MPDADQKFEHLKPDSQLQAGSGHWSSVLPRWVQPSDLLSALSAPDPKDGLSPHSFFPSPSGIVVCVSYRLAEHLGLV